MGHLHARLLLAFFLTASASPVAQAQTAAAVTGVLSGRYYNYVPTTIRAGNRLQIWWCGLGSSSDNIFYQTIDVDRQVYGPVVSVLQPTPGAWDSLHTCDPSVLRGNWEHEGIRYTYAMYYTGTDDPANHGSTNGVGVAYSNDGITWVKFPQPIFRDPPTSPRSYGIGQQGLFKADGQMAVYAFINRVTPAGSVWSLYHSPDGRRFEQPIGVVTKNGLVTPEILQADFAYDQATSYVYMATDRGGTLQAIDVYRIALCNVTRSDKAWEKVAEYNPSTTGQPYNQGPGLLRDEVGAITRFLPTLVTYFASGPNTENSLTKIWSATSTVSAPAPAECNYVEERDRGGERGAEFDEGEYLRCNPDVGEAVNRGTTAAFQHYREYGRREGRRLSC
jgi:hypothetical protein